MSELGDKRRMVSKMWALLEHYILFLGYQYARDEGKRCTDCPNTHPRSTHKVGLGQDYVIYLPGGAVDEDGTVHAILHDFWDFIGGAERIDGDLGHYSVMWQGVI